MIGTITRATAAGLFDLALRSDAEIAQMPVSQQTERDMSGKGVKHPHKGRPGKRKPPWKTDVIKVKMDTSPLSPAQVKWLLAEARKAFAYQQQHARLDIGFEEFRHEVILDWTLDHKAGQIRGLSANSGATKAHFNCLMMIFKKLQGRSDEALEWAMKDDDDQQALDLLRYLIRERLAWLGGDDKGMAYGNTLAQRMHKPDDDKFTWMDLNRWDADRFYREIKMVITREFAKSKKFKVISAECVAPSAETERGPF